MKSFDCYLMNLGHKEITRLHNLASRLKELRRRQGFTQRQLAQILKVSELTVIRWENNYELPSIESLVQMARLYHVTLDYVAGLDGKKSIVIDGLSTEQAELLRMLLVEFQSSDLRTPATGLTQRQLDILSAVSSMF